MPVTSPTTVSGKEPIRQCIFFVFGFVYISLSGHGHAVRVCNLCLAHFWAVLIIQFDAAFDADSYSISISQIGALLLKGHVGRMVGAHRLSAF